MVRSRQGFRNAWCGHRSGGRSGPKNKTITKTLISYLHEPYVDIKFATVFALSKRGDPDAIAPLEAMLKSGQLNLGDAPFIQMQIDALKAKAEGKPPAGPGAGAGAGSGQGAGAGPTAAASGAATPDGTLDALKKLQQQMDEVNARLAKIESQLNAPKKK